MRGDASVTEVKTEEIHVGLAQFFERVGIASALLANSARAHPLVL
jgi:hypothetical protein